METVLPVNDGMKQNEGERQNKEDGQIAAHSTLPMAGR
jgi:hypothetical protein